MIQQKQSIPVTEFKANFDAIIEYGYKHQKRFIITKYKKPFVKLVPFENKKISLCGSMKGSVIINGDIIDENLFTN